MITVFLIWFVLSLFVMTFYHRYFSHNSFETSRAFQFFGALIGTLAVQGGPLWWASQHIAHHKYSDRPGDPHCPDDGFTRSNFTWFLDEENRKTKTRYVRKWMNYPELMWLNRYWYIPPIIATLAMGWPYIIGAVLCFMTTILLASAAHCWGTQPHDTEDNSRNNFFIALLTMGEGWHNNHHYKPWAANHGHRWWQIDISYYFIRSLESINMVSNVKRHQ